MIYEFQVIYRAAGSEQLRTVVVRARGEGEARGLIEGTGADVCGVGPGVPVIDPQQQTFNSREACVYLHCELTTLNSYMNAGWLPKFRGGRPVFTRQQLDRVLARAAREELPWSTRRKAA